MNPRLKKIGGPALMLVGAAFVFELSNRGYPSRFLSHFVLCKPNPITSSFHCHAQFDLAGVAVAIILMIISLIWMFKVWRKL